MGVNSLQHVAERLILVVRNIEKRDWDLVPFDGTIFASVLDVSKLLVDFAALGLEPVTTPVLGLEIQADAEDHDAIEDVSGDLNRPWNSVSRSILGFPELSAEHLAQGITNEEDSVDRHFLGVASRGNRYPGEDSDKSTTTDAKQVDGREETGAGVGGKEKKQEASDDGNDEASNGDQ